MIYSRYRPQWKYREGETLIYAPISSSIPEYIGLRCTVRVQETWIVESGDGMPINVQGGAYYVHFGDGHAARLHEHQLHRPGEQAYLQ